MKYNLDIKEQVLENGMRVVLVHKPDYQKSFFVLGIPAGGFNIEEEKDGVLFQNPSGCAHFLEHQMFRLNGKDVTDDFSLMQAQVNAFTSYTETAYYFTTTADPIPPLKLLLDFVQTLDISQESLDKEKGIIVSEYNMYDQQPESRLLHETMRSLYKNHPIRTEILGEVADIEAMQVEDLQTFYAANYDPGRLVLVGITGRDTEEILQTIADYEAGYPSASSQKIERHFPAEPAEVFRSTHQEAMDISMPFVCVACKLQPAGDIEESLEKDLALSLWLDSAFGPMNPDYQTWLDTHVLSQAAGAEVDISQEYAHLLFFAQTEKVDAFVQLVQDLLKHPSISAQDFRSLQIQHTAKNLRALDNFETLAIDLLRSRFENFDYVKAMELVSHLDAEKINHMLEAMDFSNQTVTIIEPCRRQVETLPV